MLSLQRMAGNVAVAKLLTSAGGSQHLRPQLEARTGGLPVPVQRQAAFGLAKSSATSGFADVAIEFWRSNPEKSLLDFGTHLVKKANDSLAVERVPEMDSSFDSGQLRGLFTAHDWKVNVDVAQITGKSPSIKLRDLAAEQAGEVAATCFHEARHAEQSFLRARVLAGRGKDVAGILAEYDIPQTVATAAYNLRKTMHDKAVLPLVERWRAFDPGGKHFDYKKWNDDLMFFVQNTIQAQPEPQEPPTARQDPHDQG